ncbi:MAG: 5-formyltetrahydrofolate cyclo-ligase [Helicobacteraceae bacterium]|nr:5-formyltetrahydrofolate cyclo-ligase [Helicobacteraceae bacterium]
MGAIITGNAMDKRLAREEALNRLKSAPLGVRLANSAKTRKNLKRVLKALKPKSVLIYLPLPFEADLRALFPTLRRNKKLYFPLVEKISFKMVEYKLPLERQNISAPRRSGRKIEKVEVMIVPCLCVDAAFRRVGFGRGMYDRFVCTLQNRPIVIFVQPFFLRLTRVITDNWDIRGDFLVSAGGAIYNSRNLNDRKRRNRCCYGRNQRVFGVVYHPQDRACETRCES